MVGGVAVRLCNETVTIFNARLNSDIGYEEYYPTVLNGVSWYSTVAANVDSGGLNAASVYTIRIPADVDAGGKAYADPMEYADGDAAELWTINQGDVIVKGAVTETGLTPVQLMQRFGDVVTVLAVTDNRRAPNAPHWRVTGK